jgi:uncharacterized protein YndB with AHSA1/START domain
MPAPAEVTLPSDTQVRVVREFDAPRSLVYLAFTKPELVQRWLLGPPGWTMPVCEIDLRVGGTYHYRWRNQASGDEFGFRGEYRRIDPEERIDSLETPEDVDTMESMEVETRFVAVGERTRVEYLMTSASKEARDAALATGMTDGMEMSFKQLDGVLATTPA